MKVIASIVMMVCALFAQHSSKISRFNFESQIGIVDANAQRELCLNILNANLAEGDRINIILPYKPQRTVKAIINRKLNQSCSRNPDIDPKASFYSLKLIKGSEENLDPSELNPPSIAIVNSLSPIRVAQGAASVDLDRDGLREYFRICTSNEGSHLTIWSGKPLKGKRRWHAYYYLGYDVEPSCKRGDYQD